MKFKIIKMLIILGILAATPMIYMGKFNPMDILDAGLRGGSSEFDKLKAKAPTGLSSVTTDKKVQVYKWRDKNGVLQFSNTPPMDGQAETIELNPNDNVIQAVKIPEKEVVEKEVANNTERPSPYSPKGMKKVMDDVKGVEDLMNKRNEQQQEALGGY